jgi:outer membrane lipoprotein-sorting protein
MLLATMKKSIIRLAGILTFVFTAYLGLAQAPATDKKAQDILNGVSARYKSYKSVRSSFTITVENPKDKSKTTEKGTLYIKGSKYKLDIAGQEVISDGKTRWTFVKDANEVQIDNQRTDENTITPTNIFTMYEKGWQSRYMGEKKLGTQAVHEIELIPVDPKKKNIFKVKLTINKTDKSILVAKMFDKNGSIQTITVDKFIPEGASDETIFVYSATKYPGADVVDLR